jgi:hypothetical protein
MTWYENRIYENPNKEKYEVYESFTAGLQPARVWGVPFLLGAFFYLKRMPASGKCQHAVSTFMEGCPKLCSFRPMACGINTLRHSVLDISQRDPSRGIIRYSFFDVRCAI